MDLVLSSTPRINKVAEVCLGSELLHDTTNGEVPVMSCSSDLTALSSALLFLTDVVLEAMAAFVELVAVEDTAFFCDRSL